MKIKFEDPFDPRVHEIAKQFDYAFDLKDANLTKTTIQKATALLSDVDIISQAKLQYSLGTAYGDIDTINPKSKSRENYDKQLFHFRNSIELLENSISYTAAQALYIEHQKILVYTNYGRALCNGSGRIIPALENYRKALALEPNFGEALGNSGNAFYLYALLVFNETDKHLLFQQSYHCIKKSIDDIGLVGGARLTFEKRLKAYEDEFVPEYVEEVLKAPIEIPDYSYRDPEELAYRKWALSHRLFLTSQNDLLKVDIYHAHDSLHLPNMLIKTEDVQLSVLHGMINQIKQEYIYARYQFYQSLNVQNKPSFADKETCLFEFPDLPLYSIRIEMMKTAFRTVYSLFDKIAFFMNQYYDIGIRKEEHVNFKSVWWARRGGRGKEGYEYNNPLDPNDNPALKSLYAISRDFTDSLHESPNPYSKHISDLRNALEHKYVKVYSDLSKLLNREKDRLAKYVSELELRDYTLFLLKTAREAIICLLLAVNVNEKRKRGLLNNKKIPKMDYLNFEDDWKI